MRTILHCDINNCFASIEMAVNPALRGKPIAVCGDPAQRRGIVLAKSEIAKKYGVKTGDTLWMARKKCPGILFVKPHFEIYEEFSRQIRAFYERFTPLVEPFGMDECWLDISSEVQFKHWDPIAFANYLRTEIFRIFGVTISVGVSFNKIFAKLGSDLKKPNAVTAIPFEHFREKIWGLPAASLLGVGSATTQKLSRFGIHTIGELAGSDRSFIRRMLGKNGDLLWIYANGLDDSPVENIRSPRKSLGHGTTLPADVSSSAELWPVILRLSDRIAAGLQAEGFMASGIQIYVRDSRLQFHEFQRRLPCPVDAARIIADYSLMMLSQHYDWRYNIRAFGIRLYDLGASGAGVQRSLFDDHKLQLRNLQEKKTDQTIREIQNRFGEKMITRGGRSETMSMHSCFAAPG